MIKKRQIETDEIYDMVLESLQDLATVKDVTVSIEKLNRVHYPAPKQYRKKDVQRIRKKLHVSQAVLAHLLNTKITTVQKWECGVNEPNGPASRTHPRLDLGPCGSGS